MNMAAGDNRVRVFMSYSRNDADFVTWLSSALESRGCVVDFDRSTEDPGNVTLGISAEDAWRPRLKEMITSAVVIIPVFSSNIIQSKPCDDEIAFAQGLNKRIIPVLCQSMDLETLPPRLSALNVKITF